MSCDLTLSYTFWAPGMDAPESLTKTITREPGPAGRRVVDLYTSSRHGHAEWNAYNMTMQSEVGKPIPVRIESHRLVDNGNDSYTYRVTINTPRLDESCTLCVHENRKRIELYNIDKYQPYFHAPLVDRVEGDADEIILSADGREKSASYNEPGSITINARGGVWTRFDKLVRLEQQIHKIVGTSANGRTHEYDVTTDGDLSGDFTDIDGDGMTDAAEIKYGFDPYDPYDPYSSGSSGTNLLSPQFVYVFINLSSVPLTRNPALLAQVGDTLNFDRIDYNNHALTESSFMRMEIVDAEDTVKETQNESGQDYRMTWIPDSAGLYYYRSQDRSQGNAYGEILVTGENESVIYMFNKKQFRSARGQVNVKVVGDDNQYMTTDFRLIQSTDNQDTTNIALDHGDFLSTHLTDTTVTLGTYVSHDYIYITIQNVPQQAVVSGDITLLS